jgi:hypothetical protein
MPPRFYLGAVILTLSLLGGCSRPPAQSESGSTTAQKLPFDGTARTSGIAPSRSFVPSASKLPEGTPLPVRLRTAVSSESSHAGDTFSAVLDEPVVIDGQTILAAGTLATGRVLEAKASSSGGVNLLERTPEPGYLRIVLVSLEVGDKPVMIETSSIFVKGGSRERNAASGTASAEGQREIEDVMFGVDRHLSFRLAQKIDLQ